MLVLSEDEDDKSLDVELRVADRCKTDSSVIDCATGVGDGCIVVCINGIEGSVPNTGALL